MVDFSLWDIFRNLLLAARWTVLLSLIAFVGGGLVGLALLLVRLARWPGAQRGVALYVQVFQGTPLLVQLFMAFFGLSRLGLDLSAWVAASLALTLSEKMRHVIGPQALRVAVPPTVGFLVQVIKGTALASVIGFAELMKTGTLITNATFRPFTVYACVALLYFGLCWPISATSRKLERSLQRGH
jgi:polar amino acid transport system permease protein